MSVKFFSVTLLFITTCFLTSFSQVNDSVYINHHESSSAYRTVKNFELVLGYGLQGNWQNKVKNLHYFEIGVAKSIHNTGRHGGASGGFSLSEEIHFGKQNVYGTKIGFYTHYMLDLGFAIVYYTNFKKGNLKLRPEIGLGLGELRCVIGFNIPTFDNKAFEVVRQNNAQLTVQFMWPLKQKRVLKSRGLFRELFSK